MNKKISIEIMTLGEQEFIKQNWEENSKKVLEAISKDRDVLALQAIIKGQKEEIERLHFIIKEAREYLPKLRVSPSYELDVKIDTLEEILYKENKEYGIMDKKSR